MGLDSLISAHAAREAEAKRLADEESRLRYAIEDAESAGDRGQAAALTGQRATVAYELAEARKEAYWIETVVRPMATAVAAELGASHDILGPFGLGSHVGVKFSVGEDLAGYLTVSPWGLEHGQLLYDTGARTDHFARGTIGEMNGGNNVEEPLPDGFADIAAIAKKD